MDETHAGLTQLRVHTYMRTWLDTFLSNLCAFYAIDSMGARWHARFAHGFED